MCLSLPLLAASPFTTRNIISHEPIKPTEGRNCWKNLKSLSEWPQIRFMGLQYRHSSRVAQLEVCELGLHRPHVVPISGLRYPRTERLGGSEPWIMSTERKQTWKSSFTAFPRPSGTVVISVLLEPILPPLPNSVTKGNGNLMADLRSGVLQRPRTRTPEQCYSIKAILLILICDQAGAPLRREKRIPCMTRMTEFRIQRVKNPGGSSTTAASSWTDRSSRDAQFVEVKRLTPADWRQCQCQWAHVWEFLDCLGF